MIRLEVFGEAETMASVAQLLDGSEDVTRVRLTDATKPGHAVVVAVVRPRAVDGVMDDLRRHGATDDEVTLTREEVLGRSSGAGAEAGLVWEDVLGMASRNARPIARYLAFMIVAGVVGSYGVIDTNVILIVGAMAISPDLLPITAVGVGLVDRRLPLAARALVTLLIGMTLAAAAACLSASLQDVFGLIPAGFDIHSTVLGTLATVSNETIVVALAAGIAGMLALETRASAGRRRRSLGDDHPSGRLPRRRRGPRGGGSGAGRARGPRRERRDARRRRVGDARAPTAPRPPGCCRPGAAQDARQLASRSPRHLSTRRRAPAGQRPRPCERRSVGTSSARRRGSAGSRRAAGRP